MDESVNAVRFLASGIKRAALTTGWYRRRLLQDRFPGVAVLCYHGVRPGGVPAEGLSHPRLHVGCDEFEGHCRFVRETCNVISLDDWRATLAGGKPLPPRPVLFTFDDGYRTVFTVAKPILERYRIPVALLLCTQPIADRRMFWHDALVLQHGEHAVERAKAILSGDWDGLMGAMNWPIRNDDDPNAPLHIDDVRTLAEHPLFEIGAHTVSHPILRSMTAERQRTEIARSQVHVQEWTDRPARAFAYPNGRPALDYSQESVAIARSCGIDFAFTTGEAFAPVSHDHLECPRFVMLSGVDNAEMAHRLSYSWRCPPRF